MTEEVAGGCPPLGNEGDGYVVRVRLVRADRVLTVPFDVGASAAEVAVRTQRNRLNEGQEEVFLPFLHFVRSGDDMIGSEIALQLMEREELMILRVIFGSQTIHRAL